MAEAGEAYSIGFLRRTIDMYILDQRTEQNRADMHKAFQKGMAGSVPKDGAFPALSAPSPKKTTGRGKGGTYSKGKRQGKKTKVKDMEQKETKVEVKRGSPERQQVENHRAGTTTAITTVVLHPASSETFVSSHTKSLALRSSNRWPRLELDATVMPQV